MTTQGCDSVGAGQPAGRSPSPAALPLCARQVGSGRVGMARRRLQRIAGRGDEAAHVRRRERCACGGALGRGDTQEDWVFLLTGILAQA